MTKRFPTERFPWMAALCVAGALSAPVLASAQSSAIVGWLGNFDAANYEGKDAYGFEVQIEGITPADLWPAWCGNKFGCPVTVPYATGVYVRYMSPYDSMNQVFTAATVTHPANTPFAGSCYQGSAYYQLAGCDHFGVHLAYTAASKAVVTSYRWMFADTANPGTLIPSPTNLIVPAPVYTFVPPVTPTALPVLIAEVQVPDPPPPPPAVPPQFGNATWMKVFKSDVNREVALDELVATNPIVPQDVTQIETDWVLLQPAPPVVAGDNRRRRNRHRNQGGVSAATRSVVRRYETYGYTGAYDPLTHEVICGGDATCNIPQAGELGDMVAAQMVAANVAVPSLTVTLTGNGSVASADKAIGCGSKCISNYALGTVVNLTAKAGSNSSFTGWSGGCAGAALTCTTTINDAVGVGALFTANVAAGGGGGGGGATQFTVQVGRSNLGSIISDVAGINCGSSCSAKFNAGTALVLTATPPAGKTFVNWGGACSGTNNTCALTVSGNLSVQANFSK